MIRSPSLHAILLSVMTRSDGRKADELRPVRIATGFLPWAEGSAMIELGETQDNRFGHPSAAALDRLGDALLLRTDQHGTVRLSTDGERLWVRAEQP